MECENNKSFIDGKKNDEQSDDKTAIFSLEKKGLNELS